MRRKRVCKLINESMNDPGVCRTAPATPSLVLRGVPSGDSEHIVQHRRLELLCAVRHFWARCYYWYAAAPRSCHRLKLVMCQPALTVGIVVSLLGFWASEVELVDKFKLMEDMFWLSICQYQIQPDHFVRGQIYYLAETYDIAVMQDSISCLYVDVDVDVLFFGLPGVRPDKICQANQWKLSKTTA